MTTTLKRLVPGPLKRTIKGLIPYYRERYCPVCGNYEHDFYPFGLVIRPNALCPTCRSLERHRLVWIFFHEKTDLFDGSPRRMLHVAPEPALSARLRAVPGLDYLSADLLNPAAMARMDITDIPHPDDSFDVIYCSHVLEHVPDDRRAMREFRRVLKPGGWAVLLVPITVDATFEDPTVTDPLERERLFGQRDHVRRYGPDYRGRLEEAGFRVRPFRPEEVVPPGDMTRLGIPTTESPIFFCTKA